MSRAGTVSGVHVIPWEQTEIDHEENGPRDHLAPGASWRWWGAAVRLDGPRDVLALDGAEGRAGMRERAARAAARLRGIGSQTATVGAAPSAGWGDPLLGDAGFALTDGYRAYNIALIDGGRLLLCTDGLPRRDADHWVVRLWDKPRPREAAGAGSLRSFMPGTRIAAPGGTRRVEVLRPGDRVFTRDDGPQEILWTGRSTIPAARLRAAPWLRPIRLRAGALGAECPDDDLRVAPDQRLLLRGPAAQRLFATSEVLVAARDLRDDRGVILERAAGGGGVTYVHILLARHQILRANGVEAESFHPGDADSDALPADQRAALLAACPRLAGGAACYGDPARRCLTTPEAEILLHAGDGVRARPLTPLRAAV